MQNGKASGLDGFNVDFFIACWKNFKQDILKVIEDSRRFKTILKALNASFIALIPKQEKATTPDRLRPIFLCIVVYKIICKVIANKLKPLILDLVSEEQTRFVERRQILNNIIQAHEVVHSLNSRKQATMIIQLDPVKVNEKLSWAYIKEVLRAYSFDHSWIRWVMALVSMASFTILLNGSPYRTFTPSKGLRQGDTLSHFLFVLMMEGLGKVIKMENSKARIQGLKLTLEGTHLVINNLWLIQCCRAFL